MPATTAKATPRRRPAKNRTRPRLTYQEVLNFAALVREDTRDLKPRDMIDAHSFIWVQGSDEYA